MSSWLTGNLVKNSEGKRKATAERLEVESTAWARVGLASLGLGQALTTAFDLQNPAFQGVDIKPTSGKSRPLKKPSIAGDLKLQTLQVCKE